MMNIYNAFWALCVYVCVCFVCDIVRWILSQAPIRRSSSYLIGYFFKNSKLYLVDEAPNLISTLIVLLSDSDSATVVVCMVFIYLLSLSIFMLWNYGLYFPFWQVAWEALSRVVSSIPKEILPSYIKLVRDAVSTSRDKERRKRKVLLWLWNLKFVSVFQTFHIICYCFPIIMDSFHGLQGGAILLPGLCLPKALQPLLPIFLQVFVFAFLYGLRLVGGHWSTCFILVLAIRQCLGVACIPPSQFVFVTLGRLHHSCAWFCPMVVKNIIWKSHFETSEREIMWTHFLLHWYWLYSTVFHFLVKSYRVKPKKHRHF